MKLLGQGFYKTDHGSTVEVRTPSGGSVVAEFDWCEEPGACCNCVVNPYPVEWDEGVWHLTWSCDSCDGGSAELKPYVPEVA